MVIYDPARLQMRIDRNRTHILKPTFLQVFANPIGQTVADGKRSLIMTVI